MTSRSKPDYPQQLEALPNIGKSIAADLRAIGIDTPERLAGHQPIDVFAALAKQMDHRHDPCVLYTLLAVQHFLASGEKMPWWKFTEQGRHLLASIK